jgi:hypothetical protein
MSSTPLFDAIVRRTAAADPAPAAARPTGCAASGMSVAPVPLGAPAGLAGPNAAAPPVAVGPAARPVEAGPVNEARGDGAGAGVLAHGGGAARVTVAEAPAHPAATSSTPTSPVGPAAPVGPAVPAAPAAVVPTDLIAMIDGIPASLRASLAREYAVGREQLPLVEAVADAITRAVVDAVAVEVDRIIASGVVRS